MVAACAVLALPASASAATVQVFGSQINVADNAPEEQHADNIVFTKVDPWIVQLRNDAGDAGEPLLLVGEDSTTVDCIQDNPRQLTCIRLGYAPLTFDIYTNWGNDTVTIGEHNPGDTVQVRAHGGDDKLFIQNGSVDRYSCGAGNDQIVRDAGDTLFNPALPSDCENDAGGSGGGDSGGGGGGAGGGSGTYDPGTPPVATPIMNPPSLFLAGVASKPGGKLIVNTRVNGPGVVTGKVLRAGKSLAKGSKKATKAGAVRLLLKPTKAAKRLLKTKSSVKVKVKLAFKPTTGATVVKTINAKLRK